MRKQQSSKIWSWERPFTYGNGVFFVHPKFRRDEPELSLRDGKHKRAREEVGV